MKKFTNVWRVMMVLLLSSSVLLVQAQKNVSAERAPIKKEFNEEQLKQLEQSVISVKDLREGIASSENLMEAEKLLKDLKAENESNAIVMESSSYMEKIYNSKNSITVTLGTGTGSNTTTGSPTPYGTYWKNFRQQYLILASELIPLGIGPGDITALGFNVAAVNNCVDMPNFTISMKQTSVTVLTTAFDNDAYTTVFTLPSFLPAIGWNTHTFTTPFTWDGSSNLLIDICTTIIPGNYTQNASVYFTPTTGTNTCLRYQSDTQPACLTTNTGTVSVNRANMQITGEEMLNPPPGMPYNEVPINGSVNITINGDISWTFGNNTETYDLWFGPAGNMVKVIDNQPAGATGTYTYSGLNYASGYNWQVAAMNTNGTTNGPVWNFSTACGIVIPPFYEDFTTYTGVAPPPACWLEADDGDPTTGPLSIGTSLWVQDNFGNVTGSSNCPKVNLYANTKKDWLITPHFDLSTELYEVRIDIALTDWNNTDPAVMGSDDQMVFLISPDAGATWVILQTWDVTTPISNVGETVIIPLLGYNQTDVVFAFWANEGTVNDPEDYDFFIDNFKVQVPPTCPQPFALGATYIAATTADLLWTSFSGLSDIEFGLAGFPPTGVPTYTGVVSPYTVSGLTTLTAYSFYVRDDCGGGDYSLWSGPFTFTTTASCPPPFDLGATSITMTSADLLWTSFTNLSDVEFGPGGFTPTGVPTYSGVTSPYNVSGLNSASPYDFYVRDDCGGGGYSTWAGPYTLLTMPGSQGIPVYEDFENGFVYFNNAPGNNADWAINNTYYHSGAQCAHNAYDNSQSNILHETGVIDLSGAEVVFLEFWQIAKTEGNWDHCVIEISTDGGATYTPLPLETYTGNGNYHVPTSNPPYDICFDEDSYALWGTGAEIPDNTWWQLESFDLSDYLMTNVRIRFRLDSDGSIIRYGWLLDEVLIYEPAYGTLAGLVTNAANSNPVEGATISVGSLSATSGADGTYNLPGILIGTWNANCTAVGYNPSSAPVTILENQTTTHSFSLTSPGFVVAPLTVDVTLEPNQLMDDYVNMSNPGLGTVDWSAGVVVIGDGGSDELFDLQFDWPVGIGGGEAGIECDGSYIYTTKWNGTEFYKYELNGTYIGPFTCGAAGAIRDLAFDGTYFYGAAAATTVFQMDFTNGVVVSSFTAPLAIRAIAYNQDEDVFYGNNWSDNITIFDQTGANLGSFPCGPVGSDYYGFAYDNSSSGSPYLWGYAQTGTTLNELVQIQLPSGVETGISFDVGSVAGVGTGIAGGLAITDAIIPGFFTLLGTAQNVDIWGLELCESGPVWLTIEPNSGILAPGTNEDMTLHFNATDILPGIYQAEIHFSTDPDVGSPIVAVTMTVEGLIPAINLQASFNCTDVLLSWEMPTGGNPDSWNVYKDGSLLGNSTVMSYTDEMVAPSVELSYYVTAVYAGDESMPSAPAAITVPVPGSLQPIGLSASANTPSQGYVTLDWNEPNACLEPDGYHIYRDNVQITTTPVTGLTYVDGPLGNGLYEYKLKAAYYFGESGFSSPAYALITVGIEETGDDMLRIYPNPASQMVTIESTMEITGIKVFNNSGQVVLDEKVNVMSYQIDVSKFDKGIYYIRLVTGDTKILRKITVK